MLLLYLYSWSNKFNQCGHERDFTLNNLTDNKLLNGSVNQNAKLYSYKQTLKFFTLI